MAKQSNDGKSVVKLRAEQVSYMLDTLSLAAPLVSALQNESARSIRLTAEQRSQIMSAVSTRLQVVGFDKDYVLTPEGMLLESIVDALTSAA